MERKYKKSRSVKIGGKGNAKTVLLGGGNPVTVQTMWKRRMNVLSHKSLEHILSQLEEFSRLGCDILRFSVPDIKSAHALLKLSEVSPIPIVADIHFDFKLALECLKGNISVVRINPGNIGNDDKVREIIKRCRDTGTAIRIGVNSGSLPKDLAGECAAGRITKADALCKAALREAEILDNENFGDYVVSIKSSSAEETVKANEAFARVSDAPLHIGVTEAGPALIGTVKSTYAITRLLSEGIGDTVRVSLSSPSEDEIIAGNEILKVLGLRKGGVNIISCPRCGRVGFDVHSFVKRWQHRLLLLNKDITVAVMGCVVNGVGEGKNADIGITGGDNRCIIFKKGKIVRTIDAKDADKVFEEELESLLTQ